MKLYIFCISVIILCGFSFLGSAKIEVIGKMIYRQAARSGEKYSSEFKVRNTGDLDQEVKIYLRDYTYNYKGDSYYDVPGTNKRSNSLWIQFNPQVMILKPHETQNIRFEVTIPAMDSLKGTFWSLLMVEGVKPFVPGSLGQLTVHESVRYAIQIITSIGNTGTGVLEFRNPDIEMAEGKKYFKFAMFNTGERLISPDVSMELFDTQTGASVTLLKAPRNGMYPGTSTLWKFPLDGLTTRKTYKALIVADGSGNDVFGIEYTLSL
jgi:hypothetical protein